MGMQAYRSILALRAVRRVLWLSIVVRVPLWAGNVVLTLHVVTHLHRSYGAAGLLVGVGHDRPGHQRAVARPPPRPRRPAATRSRRRWSC